MELLLWLEAVDSDFGAAATVVANGETEAESQSATEPVVNNGRVVNTRFAVVAAASPFSLSTAVRLASFFFFF
jgi:hypothetical protein